MAPMPALTPLAKLYPPRSSPEFHRFLRSIAETERDADGNFVLRRALVPAERDMLEVRSRELGPWLQHGSAAAIGSEVARMMLSWGASGKAMTPAEAASVASQYAVVLGNLPLWAVAWSCRRWSDGSVRPDEVGAETINLSFPPAAPQVRRVADDVVRPFGEERERIRLTLAGEVAPPDERGAVPDSVLKWLADKKAEAEENRPGYRAMTEEQKNKGIEAVLREYDAMGLARPAKIAGEMPCSPSLVLQLGGRIAEERGRRVLLMPERPKPPAQERAPAELDDGIPF